MKVPHVPVKEALQAALDKAREARDAVKEAADRLRTYVEQMPNKGEGDADFEAAEIALDELHGADTALANVEDRLKGGEILDDNNPAGE